MSRDQTRLERYWAKMSTSSRYPISLCTVSFANDANTAMSLRSAVCFGFSGFHIIGRAPERKVLKAASGSMSDFITTREFKNPAEYVDWGRRSNKVLLSLELTDYATNIEDFVVEPNKEYSLVVGNEYTGTPMEILHHSQHLYIPMPGIGYCLNSAMAASVAAHEFSKKFRHLTQKGSHEIPAHRMA